MIQKAEDLHARIYNLKSKLRNWVNKVLIIVPYIFKINKMEKKDLLKDTIKHIDIKSYDSTQLIDAMRDMSFTSRDTARATDIRLVR